MRGTLHHVELWVPHLGRATASLGWLLETLGYQPYQHWANGRSWRLGDTYIVIEQSPALTGPSHDRCQPGLNHLAFHVGDLADLDSLVTAAGQHGWALMFADQHPNAGGRDHYAGYIENADGFEVELVAGSTKASRLSTT
jgi:catechol-2,3-dioxygenase